MEWWDRGVSEFARLPDDLRWTLVVGPVVFVLVMLAVAWGNSRARRAARRAPPQPVQPARKPPVRVELARISEQIETTTGGGFGIVMLVLHQFFIFIWFASAKTAFQEISIATLWVGGNVLWGLVAALGRRRTYVVTREAPRE